MSFRKTALALALAGVFPFGAALLPGSGSTPQPTFVQHTTGCQNTTFAGASMTYTFPNPCGGGNCVAIPVQSGTSVTGVPTATDNIGTNTYTAFGDVVGGQRLTWLVAVNVAAGTQKITVTFTGASPTFTQCAAYEFYNVATASPLDTSNTKNSGTNASPVTCGGLTTTTDGALILMAMVDETTGPPTANTNYQVATAGFQFLATNPIVGTAVVYGVQQKQGAISPAITVTGGSDSFVASGIALKSAIAGTPPPPGPRIVGVLHIPAYASVVVDTMPFQFPCFGNLLVASSLTFSLSAASSLRSILDNKGNAWKQAPNSQVSGLSNVQLEIWYAGAATAGHDLAGTINWKSTLAGTSGGDSHLVLYDIAGADLADPLSVVQTATGTQAVTADLATVTWTPLYANEIAILAGDITSHTASGVSAPAISDIYVEPGMNGAGNDLAEDAPWAHMTTTDLSSHTFTFQIQNNTAPNGVGAWGATVATFRGAPAPLYAGKPAPMPSRAG